MKKKILIADDVYSYLKDEPSFLNRSDIMAIRARSNGEALEIHMSEKADLIIATIDSSDIKGESFCDSIRDDSGLKNVSIIVVSPGDLANIERGSRCRANAFMALPLDKSFLIEKAHELLNIPRREEFRAPISVKVNGKYMNSPFLCHSENISASGMLFETERELTKGDTIVCTFMLPNSMRVTASAEIVRIVKSENDFDPNQYGIRFEKLHDEIKTAIEEYISRFNK